MKTLPHSKHVSKPMINYSKLSLTNINHKVLSIQALVHHGLGTDGQSVCGVSLWDQAWAKRQEVWLECSSVTPRNR